jgi:hypothetical protein
MHAGIDHRVGGRAQARFRVRGPGRPAIRKDLVLSLPPEKLALITLSTVLTATCIRGRDATVTGIAGHIAEVCRLETEYQALRKTTPPWKRRTVIGWRNLPPREDRLVEWKFVGEKVNVGEELIQLLLDNVGGFRVEYRPAAPGRNPCARAAILALTRQAEEWLTTAHAEAEGLAPVSLPMIVVPEPWQGLAGGGYVTNRRTGALPLVKHLDDINIKELHAANLAGVYRAVNALQSTAWAINVDICALVRQAWNRRLDVGNLPLGTPESPRERPGEVPDRERKNLRLKWRRWYGKKGGVVSSATMLRMRLKYARLLKD